MEQARSSGLSKRERLLDAAERLMLKRGFWGTSVEEVCAAAAVTKGAFFHYFDGKEQLALEALDRFVGTMVGRIRQAIENADSEDEFSHICAYCDLIGQVAQVQQAQEGCLIATFVMETRTDDGAFAKRCSEYFGKWIEILKNEFAAALCRRQRANPQLAAELAQMCVCVIEGALVLAKGCKDPLIVATALEHFKGYATWVIGNGAAEGIGSAGADSKEGRPESSRRAGKNYSTRGVGAVSSSARNGKSDKDRRRCSI